MAFCDLKAKQLSRQPRSQLAQGGFAKLAWETAVIDICLKAAGVER